LNVRLNDTTVHDNDAYDVLKGNHGRDLFFYNFAGSGVRDKAKGIRRHGRKNAVSISIDRGRES